MKPRRATGVVLLPLVSWLLAVPGAPEVASDAPSAFGRARGVQEISEQGVPPAPGSEPDTEVEPDIAVDPNDPNIVVAVVRQGRYPSGGGSVGPGFATSHDGGRRWVEGNLPGLTEATGGEFDRATDPAVAFGPDGSAYANHPAVQRC